MFDKFSVRNQAGWGGTLIMALALAGFAGVAPVAKAATTTALSAEEIKKTELRIQILQLQLQLALLMQAKAEQDRANNLLPNKTPNTVYENPHFMTVNTFTVGALGRNSAELQAKVDKGSSPTADLYFQYGEGNSLNKESEYVEVKVTRESLLKARLTDLKPGKKYSYRAVMRDQSRNLLFGETMTFTTIGQASSVSTFTGAPTVENESISKVTASGAEVKIFVNMNDYDTGRVYLVWAVDKADVQGASKYKSFDDIPKVKDKKLDLNKILVSKSVSDRVTVVGRLSGLTKATRYYYRSCVDYKDATASSCSGVESMITTN